ncbi:MAG: ABC transporter ATP-binding protein/permease [Clostridiales bacterium]|nr:ABC transporter ATP-binding protein/permease [Clostridiales bacterium]
MLQIKSISKEYITGDLHQTALDKVSLNLRDNEFVAILGPSGSGKTTLLNIIGGLDRYDSGDLVINGISTKKYKDRDWDSYRNHTIGFVFQSYNLIPHQSILANVELALTISGVSRSERKRRAKEALAKVGLGDQLHKRPNQMSGGQMQRVAIARALVNDPKILLADEPTGALDTETSLQVMELLKEVAKDRLVVMVTHNPELAETYATRIVKLRDGKIISDSDAWDVDEEKLEAPQHKNMGKASMSFLTALSLSFNNLRTKKGRTILTAFAGSIGIIGIALILSLSNGVNNYIEKIQKDTMTSYPIQIEARAMDLASVISMDMDTGGRRSDLDHDLDAMYVDNSSFEQASTISMSVKRNNLTEFKKYLDDPQSEIHKYVGENGISYSYYVPFTVYSYDPDGELINLDGSNLREEQNRRSGGDGLMSGLMNSPSIENMSELMTGSDGSLVSPTIKDNYELLYGEWPDAYDEIVLVMDPNNEVSAMVLYEMGILPRQEYRDILKKLQKSEDISFESRKIDYSEILAHTYYLIPACDSYVKQESGFYKEVSEGDKEFVSILEKAIPLKITGVIRLKDGADFEPIGEAIGYTRELTEYLINYAQKSELVSDQFASPDNSVINGAKFSPSDDEGKIEDARNWLSKLSVKEKADFFRSLMDMYSTGSPDEQSQMLDMTDNEMAALLDSFLLESEEDADQQLLMIYDEYISVGTFEENMTSFGFVDRETPSSINIYADSFEDKEGITDCIDKYNETATEEDAILYTDYIGLLMSSVTTIVNVISYVLIAFVAVSLVVSSIMIGIITYISVLERTKEIGILRAIGASKRNISQVFNAETFIIGLLSGLLGIGITLLLLIPGNMIIHAVVDVSDVSAQLPVAGAIVLIVLSIVLTLIGGFIPSKKAAKKDPVAALRTE